MTLPADTTPDGPGPHRSGPAPGPPPGPPPSTLFPPALPVLATSRDAPDRRAWAAELPVLVERLRERWQLRLGAPYHGGSCAWAAPAWLADGTRAVLKVTWPHPEAREEGTALRLCDGRGAVRLHAADAELFALLIERCEPGTRLDRTDRLPADERLVRAASVLRRCQEADPDAATAAGVPRLAGVAARWADLADERADRAWPAAVDTGLFRLGSALLRELPRSAPGTVLLHGDFNPGNVLAATREPWLAIDPKPMTGDPAYDPWPLIEQTDDPFGRADPRAVLRRRTALVADRLGLDADRLCAWAVARQVEFALWTTAQAPNPDRARQQDPDPHTPALLSLLHRAGLLADLAGL
ncbi:aminoglycoside phosphotransferase family protein [Streptomyces cacaoi]|uniref:Streptomycin 6-kinase n=1 Tax=Streptomyces cacaoi TaxID=1898 RepID=A0A4Y3R9Z5_STRCI|nr:aminoglycoside phosphotransferase family protein [Streptomyces cacaoi]NNG85411.1 phosphotransferase [Streptomyces cacaoi]GEB52630.1 streptomycin 6-kinase [Streptomyces cacaoi]